MPNLIFCIDSFLSSNNSFTILGSMDDGAGPLNFMGSGYDVLGFLGCLMIIVWFASPMVKVYLREKNRRPYFEVIRMSLMAAYPGRPQFEQKGEVNLKPVECR